MGEKRITYFGWTDYSVASFELIVTDLKEEFLSFTRNTIQKLEELKEKAKDNFNRLDDAEEIIGYIEFCITLFQNFEYDFKRILSEISHGVENKHINIINQIYERSCYEDKISALEFKREHIARDLKDEPLRPLLDDIYSVSRELFSQNKLLGDLSKRLQTFIGSEAKIQEITIQDDKKKQKIQKVIPFPTPEEISWEDIIISFLSNKAVWIIAGNEREGRQFPEIGLSNSLSKKPNILCLTLVSFGKQKGEISWNTLGLHLRVNRHLKTHIYRLNKLLMQIFQIKKEKAFEYSNKTKTYKTKFKVKLEEDDIYDDILDDFKVGYQLPYQKKIEN